MFPLRLDDSHFPLIAKVVGLAAIYATNFSFLSAVVFYSYLEPNSALERSALSGRDFLWMAGFFLAAQLGTNLFGAMFSGAFYHARDPDSDDAWKGSNLVHVTASLIAAAVSLTVVSV